MFLLLENQISRMPSKVFNRHLTLSCVKHVLYLVLLFSGQTICQKKTQNIKLKLSTRHFLGVKRVSLQIIRLINARSTALTSSFIMSPLDFHGFVYLSSYLELKINETCTNVTNAWLKTERIYFPHYLVLPTLFN